MKKSEMRNGATYIICPNQSRKLFMDAARKCPCDGQCPQKDKEKLAILCPVCNKLIILDGDYSNWRRIICTPSESGCGANLFRAIESEESSYSLLYEVPTSN